MSTPPPQPPPPQQPPQPSQPKRLYRSRRNRMVAGVCGGVAEYFNWDPTLVRVIFVLSFLLPGPQILAYIVAWVIVPNAPEQY